MKKVIILSLLILPCIARGDDDARIQMLDAEIARLTAERDEKYAALEQCEKTTHGFKIAGIGTLVATGVGVYGNVKLAQKIKSGGSSSGGKGTVLKDTRSREEMVVSSCELVCDTTNLEKCAECLEN